jgi:hypothetical protein
MTALKKLFFLGKKKIYILSGKGKDVHPALPWPHVAATAVTRY